MGDLITELEAATGGSRDLDVRITLAVKSNRAPHPHGMRGFVIPTDEPWDRPISAIYYTTSLDAAMTLIPEWADYQFGCDGQMKFHAELFHNDTDETRPTYEGYAASPALAFCIAALRARNNAVNQT